MKKLTLTLMAAMLFLAVGERFSKDGLVIQKSLADGEHNLKPTPQQCQVLNDVGGKLNTINNAINEDDSCSPCLWPVFEGLTNYYKEQCT